MRVRKAILYILGFGLARALLFLSPLLMANLLPLEQYGQFELAQSLAAIGALIFGLGLSSTVPLIRLRKEIEGRWDSLLLLVSVLSFSCFVIGVIVGLARSSFSATLVLVSFAVGVLILQSLWASTLKSDGRSSSAVFVEAGFWSMAVLGSFLVALSDERFMQASISFVLLAYGGGLLAFTLIQFRRQYTIGSNVSITGVDLRRNIRLGMPLMFTGMLTVIISSSGRVVLGQTSGLEAVGLYSVLYRATTIPLIGHQLLIIGYFRQLFSWSEDVLRARAPVIVLSVTAMAIAFWLLEPYFGWLLGKRFAETFASLRIEGLALLVQTILWSAIALNDLINSRLQIAGRVTRVTAPYLAISLSALALWTWSRALILPIEDLMRAFVLGHFAVIIGFFACQCFAAKKLGHQFKKLWRTVAACTLITSGLFLAGEVF